jgi:hypothetical protein
MAVSLMDHSDVYIHVECEYKDFVYPMDWHGIT